MSPKRLTHLQPVYVGEAQVEHDQVVVAEGEAGDGSLTGVDDINRVRMLAQAFRKERRGEWFVLYEEQTHRYLECTLAMVLVACDAAI
jgi:hypothetical protein